MITNTYTHIHTYIQSDEIVQNPALPTPKKKKEKPRSKKENTLDFTLAHLTM